jgi:predicted ATPase
MARLRTRQDRQAEARELLASVYGKFSEGFSTSELSQAGAMLSQLATG